MAEEDQQPTEETTEPHGEATEPEADWKAKYEEAVANSRKWEARAKRNSDKAKEFDALKQSQMSDADKLAEAQKALEEATKRADALKLEHDRLAWAKDAAKKAGITEGLARLLKGDTADEVMSAAELAKAEVTPKVVVPSDGNQPERAPQGAADDWLRSTMPHNHNR